MKRSFFNFMVEEFDSAYPECNPGMAKLVNKYLGFKKSESGEKLRNEQFAGTPYALRILSTRSPKTNITSLFGKPCSIIVESWTGNFR